MLCGHPLLQAYKEESRITSRENTKIGRKEAKRKRVIEKGARSSLDPEVTTDANAAGRLVLRAGVLQ